MSSVAWPLSAFADEAGKSCDEQIVALKRDGLKFIDIRGMDGHNISKMPPEVAEAAKKKLDAAGIKVMMFGSPIGKIDIADNMQTDLDRLTHMGRLSQILGCNRIRIFSYFNKTKLDQSRWQAESLGRLRQLRDLAGELGLELYHENESNIYGDRLANVTEISQKLRDGKAFRLIFDFDNYRRDGDDVWANWQKLADVTDAFHLKDSNEQNQHVPAGEGAGQIKRILTDAVKRGWQGPVILEPHLQHSDAVKATGVSGQASATYKSMPLAEAFHIAAVAGIKVINEAGAKRT